MKNIVLAIVNNNNQVRNWFDKFTVLLYRNVRPEYQRQLLVFLKLEEHRHAHKFSEETWNHIERNFPILISAFYRDNMGYRYVPFAYKVDYAYHRNVYMFHFLKQLYD